MKNVTFKMIIFFLFLRLELDGWLDGVGVGGTS